MDRCLWFTIAAVGLLALGCTAPAPLPPAGAEDQPRYGGTITIGIGQDPWDFDLSIIGRSAGNSDSIFLSYESVIGVKTGPEVDYHEVVLEPLLAERWEVSPDARIFTFHLRKGVKFADLPPVDGRQLTSADVKWSHEYWTRTGPFKDKGLRAGQFAFYLAGLDRVEAPDPGTVVVHFKEPFAPFLNYAAAYQNPILPHEIYDLDGNFSSRIVGTGPWQYDEAASQKGTRWVWKKNPDYWQPGRPYIEEVRRIILPDPATFGPAFKTKQIDLITQSLQQGEQLGPVRRAQVVRLVPGVVRYLGDAHHLARFLPEALLSRGEHDVDRLRREGLVGDHVFVGASRGLGEVSLVEVHGRDVAEHGQLDVEHRHFQMGRPAAPGAPEQTSHAGQGGVEGGGDVGGRDAVADGRAPGLAGDGHVAADALENQVEGGPIAPGPSFPVAARVHEDDARVPFLERLEAQAQAVHGAGAEVRDDGVRARREVEERLPPLGLLEVEHDAFLAPVEGEEDA